jgi:uncharacterized protein YbcV (DUF1398 family)
MKGTAMDAERISIAKICLDAAYDGRLSFPETVEKLIAAGFEGYAVDFRRNSRTCYLPDGDSIVLDMPPSSGRVAPAFDANKVEVLIRWAQANPADYGYAAFCEKVKATGCAGYMVSFTGRRVVYFGRTAEIHVEHFPARNES